MKLLSLVISILIVQSIKAQNLPEGSIWKISNRNSIVWNLTKESRKAHSDNIEMAGLNIAAIINYSIDKSRNLTVSRDLIYPQLRTFIKSNESESKKHRAYLRHIYGNDIQPNIYHKGKILIFDKVDSIEIAGKLIFYHVPVQGIALTRTLMPSMTERLFVEKWEITNKNDTAQNIIIGNTSYQTSLEGYKGKYNLHTYTDSIGARTLLPGQQYSFAIYFSAGINDESTGGFDFRKVENQRNNFLTSMQENLILETPDSVLNTLFYFSKIRAAESIYNSKMGKVHSPGGGNYYVGIWANDQIEYSGPFFPFLGYDTGNEAAYNAYKMFLKNIPENFAAISSSFEIDGELPCCGKDRGDAAMIALGTSQFLLLRGDKKIAKELWPLVNWSLEYCHRMLNKDGIVRSSTDEMEGRIATGSANLSTNSLYYGGLKFSSYLAKELGLHKEAKIYLQRLKKLGVAIEKQFGANLEGLETYRYFVGSTHLRHWICLPLVMGITKRAEGTISALLDKLWTEDGVLVELNPSSTNANVFWDRGTLYALRGTFKAGAIEKSLSKLEAFSRKRLLGDHVPYVIEAYPENNMRHLSAESALYCRIFIEGLLSFEQTGFRSFVFKPTLPSGFNEFALNKIHLANTEISIKLKRSFTQVHVMIFEKDSLIFDKTVNSRQKVSMSF
jgi:hypothetical protein